MVKIFIFFLKNKIKNKIKCIKTEPNQIEPNRIESNRTEPNKTELTGGFGSISNTNKLKEKYTQKVMIA